MTAPVIDAPRTCPSSPAHTIGAGSTAGGRQQAQGNVGAGQGDQRQGQQADRDAQQRGPLGRRAGGEQFGQAQADGGDDRGLESQTKQQGHHHRRSPASSMARRRASASSGSSRPLRPSRAVAALAAEPLKKVLTSRRRAPAAITSVCGAGA